MCEGEWRALLEQAVQESSLADVARKLGVSRTAVSLVFNGKYPGNPRRMAARIEAYYGRMVCPYSGHHVSRAECAELAGKIPTSSPAAMRHWRACRKCERNSCKSLSQP